MFFHWLSCCIFIKCYLLADQNFIAYNRDVICHQIKPLIQVFCASFIIGNSIWLSPEISSTVISARQLISSTNCLYEKVRTFQWKPELCKNQTGKILKDTRIWQGKKHLQINCIANEISCRKFRLFNSLEGYSYVMFSRQQCDGKEQSVLIWVSPNFNRTKKSELSIGLVTDVTELNHFKENLWSHLTAWLLFRSAVHILVASEK